MPGGVDREGVGRGGVECMGAIVATAVDLCTTALCFVFSSPLWLTFCRVKVT